MREMKDSGLKWVGNIPTTWHVKKLKYVADINTEVIPENYEEEAEIDYIEIGSVTYEGGVNSTEVMKFQNAPSRARRIVHEGDTIISTVRTYLKAIAFIDDSLANKIASTGFSVISPNLDVDKKYLYYGLSTHSFISDVEAHSVGISYPAINNTELINLKLVVPEYDVQHNITDYLDSKCSKINAIIKREQDVIEKLKEYKLSVITEAVTKGLNPDVEMKDSGVEWIGEIPQNWEIIKLKYVLDEPMKYGASETGVEYSDELPRYIRITDITIDNNLKESSKLSLTNEQAKGYLLDKETVLFARSGGTVGKTFLYKPIYGKAAFAGYLISGVVNTNKMLSKWLYYYTLTNAYWEWANRIFTQATIQNIGADKYSNMPIVITSIDEQQQIIKYLDNKCSIMDKTIKTKQFVIDKLTEYKKSLIYEVITGKKEI